MPKDITFGEINKLGASAKKYRKVFKKNLSKIIWKLKKIYLPLHLGSL